MSILRSTLAVVALALGCSLTWAAGCGGASKPAEEPAPPVEEEVAPEPEEDVLIPGEKFDELQHFFDRKRRIVALCVSEAVEAGEMKGGVEGHLTLSMTITPEGALRELEIVEITPDSAALRSCVLETASRWTVTTLPKPLEYSYTFGFGTL